MDMSSAVITARFDSVAILAERINAQRLLLS